jgi:hypothetical protein
VEFIENCRAYWNSHVLRMPLSRIPLQILRYQPNERKYLGKHYKRRRDIPLYLRRGRLMVIMVIFMMIMMIIPSVQISFQLLVAEIYVKVTLQLTVSRSVLVSSNLMEQIIDHRPNTTAVSGWRPLWREFDFYGLSCVLVFVKNKPIHRTVCKYTYSFTRPLSVQAVFCRLCLILN